MMYTYNLVLCPYQWLRRHADPTQDATQNRRSADPEWLVGAADFLAKTDMRLSVSGWGGGVR